MQILPVVEGDGDMAAVPELMRRIAHDHGRFDIDIPRPQKRGDLPKVLARFDNYLEVALLDDLPILWVLDYDCDDCKDVAKHTATLNAPAAVRSGKLPVEFVFMVKEFETLFLADAQTTRSVFPDIAADTSFPADPESVRDAKGWLSSARPKGLAYKPMQHQHRLAAQVNLSRLRKTSPSFDRFEQALIRLLGHRPSALRRR